MVSIKLFLDRRRPKKDGTYPLNYLVCYKRKTTTRSTGISLWEQDWDDITKQVKKTHPSYKAINLRLKKDLSELQSELLLADEIKVQSFLKPERAAEKAVVVVKQKTLYQFAQDLIDNLRANDHIGNAWVYESTVNALKRYHPNEELYFEQLNYEFLDSYKSYLIRKQIKHNSIYLYLRTLRIFYNKAIKVKLVDRTLYPFNDFKLAPEKTRKRAIDKEVIKQIIEVELPQGSTIWHVQNWFVLSFYLIGISIVDLALLKTENYKQGRIAYKRKKTGRWYDIKVTANALAILNKYIQNQYGNKNSYLLPIINTNSTDEEVILRNVKDRTKLLNKYLKRIAELIKHDGNITTYTARHSWATIAKRLGTANELIAEALGHEYGNQTTAIYLDNFEQSVIDDLNQRVQDSL